MRVVLLNQYYAPDDAATAQLLADLGEGLVQEGHEVRAICSNRAYADPRKRYAPREDVNGVAVRRCGTTGFGRGSKLGRLLDYLTFFVGASRALVFQRRADVVVSLSTPPLVALLGLSLARLRGARSVYWVMDVYPELAFELGVLHPRSLAGRVLGLLSSQPLRRSDRVVALGETMAKRLLATRGRPVEIVHNWADGETIRPRELADHPLRESWGWQDRFVVLYSGNMGLAHAFDTVLAAAERLQDHADVLFAFVGGGPRRAEVEAAVARRGLRNVEFRPYVARDELGLSLTAGDLHLVTLRDSLPGLLVPSKIYGILAAGRATLYVGPAAGEIATILEQGACGTRVGSDDVEGLVDAVLAYRRERSRLQDEGRRARAQFEARFTKEHGLQAFARILSGGGSDRDEDATTAA